MQTKAGKANQVSKNKTVYVHFKKNDNIDCEGKWIIIIVSVDRERDRYRLEDEKEKYVYFWQKHSVFSQWYPCTFVIDGIKYNCAEQYMMYKKAGLLFM